MSKKAFPIVLIILGVLSVALAIFFVTRKPEDKGEVLSPGGESLPETTVISDKEELKTYNDGAGFSFQCYESLKVKEKENQDEKTYSSLELTSDSRPGETLTIKVEDTSFSTIDEWLARNRKSDWQINETVLSGMNGKFIGSPEKTITAAISQGILFLIESPAGTQSYWKESQKVIGESFKVSWPTPKKVSLPVEDSGVEEIIE